MDRVLIWEIVPKGLGLVEACGSGWSFGRGIQIESTIGQGNHHPGNLEAVSPPSTLGINL